MILGVGRRTRNTELWEFDIVAKTWFGELPGHCDPGEDDTDTRMLLIITMITFMMILILSMIIMMMMMMILGYEDEDLW